MSVETAETGGAGAGGILLALTVGLFALWLGGLVEFVAEIPRRPPPVAPSADGIVVLTGGAEARLSVAATLLSNGKGERLLISGVNPETTRDDLKALLGFDNTGASGTAPPVEPEPADAADESAAILAPRFECCVDLDRQALDTMGNAQQAARWASYHGYKSIIVVTATYHMPRSLLEFRRAMPGVTLFAYPVPSPAVKLDSWWRWPGTTRLVLTEYNKFLVSALRVAA